MSGRLKLITAPTVEPVTAAEVKLSSHISHSVEDSLIAIWIAEARELAEIILRKSLITQTWELSFDGFPEMPIDLPRSPVQSITSVTYYDYLDAATVITSTNYQLDTSASPARLGLIYGYTWPGVTLRKIDSVKIRYVSGYGASAAYVPASIRSAIILYCTIKDGNRMGEDGDASKKLKNALASKRIHL